jgi:RHS repeat-associated protein
MVDGVGATTYSYDVAGQLLTEDGPWADDTVSYTYNNRLRASVSVLAPNASAWVQSYGYDGAKRLRSVASPAGTLTVAGTTTSPATNVTVNGQVAALYGDATFAAAGFTLANGTNTITAIGTDNYGRSATNVSVSYLPSPVSFTYDLNGNLTGDGLRCFAYDDENQLTSVWVTNVWRSDFVYDGKMRRRVRFESTWNGSAWVTNTVVRYVYDGNLVIQERDANNLPLVTYTRGRDLSGSLEGAGGIGGLLARTDQQSTVTDYLSPYTTYYHADGNGNITCLINTNQIIVAHYLYDPYGSILSQSGPLADANLYRFSSKEFHVNSGLVYYLYRFYDPSLQRWPNRDPLAEQGHRLLRGACRTCYAALRKDVNSYQFCENSPIVQYDPFGLLTKEDCDDAYEADMKKVRAEGLKCVGSAVVWAIGGEIIFGGGGVVVGGVIGAGAGGVGAVPGMGIGLAVGTGVDVIVDTCHYLHCKHKVDAMKKKADQDYQDCLKKVDK